MLLELESDPFFKFTEVVSSLNSSSICQFSLKISEPELFFVSLEDLSEYCEK